MADHYDTAYMLDRYDPQYGGTGAASGGGGSGRQPFGDGRPDASGADLPGDEPQKAARLRCLADPPDRRGVPRRLPGSAAPDAMSRRRPAEMRVLDHKRRRDLSKIRIQGVYVLDMVAHNNDKEPDVFQISARHGPAFLVAGGASAR